MLSGFRSPLRPGNFA
uniref:Uncharacterized protein n=1 Tax=Arundo donax TaxID=35708 RepID=A0A0A8Y8H6_ARUDO